mgnify:CR=1 FL=1
MPSKRRSSKNNPNETFPHTLKSYWRYAYAAAFSGSLKKNPFASLKTDADAKRYVVVRSAHACLILNPFPYSAGHLMAIPYRVVARLEDLTDEETLELQHLIVTGKLLLEKVFKTDGFNIGLNQGHIAGGSVPTHLHWHIVPRWQGDHNFMPVIGRTRILVQSLEGVWKALCAAYKKA